MPECYLKAEYARLEVLPSVENWLNSLSASERTRGAALYSILRYSKYTGKDPEELIAAKEAELTEKSAKARFKTEDTVRGFVKNVKGAHTYGAYVKSFFAANHLHLDLKLVRPPPQREPVGLPSDAKLRDLAEAAGTRQLKALVLFLTDSGARIGSVLKLRYKHIKPDFEAGVLPCRVSFPASITKGGRAYVGFIGADAAAALKDYLTWRSTDRQGKDIHGKVRTIEGRPLNDDSYLFESRTGRALSHTTIIGRIGNVAYDAGLITTRTGLKTFHPHVLRQRAQTILEGSGVPLNWVDMLLGHIPRGASASAYS
jgi:integrase